MSPRRGRATSAATRRFARLRRAADVDGVILVVHGRIRASVEDRDNLLTGRRFEKTAVDWRSLRDRAAGLRSIMISEPALRFHQRAKLARAMRVMAGLRHRRAH